MCNAWPASFLLSIGSSSVRLEDIMIAEIFPDASASLINISLYIFYLSLFIPWLSLSRGKKEQRRNIIPD